MQGKTLRAVYFLISEFEGERIPHLDKLRDYKLAKQEEERERKEQKLQDDYVLHRLFKKTGMSQTLCNWDSRQNICHLNSHVVSIQNCMDHVNKTAIIGHFFL